MFDSTKPAGTPKQRFAYLFPSREAALISVRMRAGLSRSAANAHDRADPPSGGDAASGSLAHGESYLVTGEPVIVADLTSSITHSIELLLIAVLLVMAATLGLIFRAPAPAAARAGAARDSAHLRCAARSAAPR